MCQDAFMPLDTILRKHYKSPDPALNVMKHNELVSMDATWFDAPTIDCGVTNDHNLIVTLICLEHQSAVSMIKLGYTSCSSAYSDLGFCCYGEPDSSTDSCVYGLDPVSITGNSISACLSCALPHIMRNAASINTLVESFVGIPSPKLKQMSVRPYEEQPKSMMQVCQSLLLTMNESTIIVHDGRLASDPFKIISLDSSLHEWNCPVSASTSIATPFAAPANTSAHDATVGNCDSMSSMNAVTWKPVAVQVYEESKDFSIALTLDMDRVSKIGLDILGADGVVTSLVIEREACDISSITDQVPFLEYEDL